jgi:exodeoxyribonuclease VII large subunit
VKKVIEGEFGLIRVRGEVGRVSRPASGHLYFDLKDDRNVIAAVSWKGQVARMQVRPEEGMEVVATGRMTTFPGQSKYQLIVDDVAPAGMGALMAMLEKRRVALAAEGLFDAARKQPIPYLPGVIGVVTSPSGAVIRDILHRLRDRFPRHVLIWPVAVQGQNCAPEVAAAIRGFNAIAPGGPVPRPDLIIVARGGGSLEDLWGFNEEVVVRAAAASVIPLISAVGHETDVTLIDFAADRRAPTPTAAAEMAVPVRAELIARVDALVRRSLGGWLRGMDARRTELRAAARGLPDADELLAAPRQRLDTASERLSRALRAGIQLAFVRYARVSTRLAPDTLRTHVEVERRRLAVASDRSRNAFRTAHDRRAVRLQGLAGRLALAMRANVTGHRNAIARDRERVQGLALRAERAAGTLIRRRVANVEHLGQLLAAFSYRGVLARGFALVRDLEGTPLRAAAAVSPGLHIDIEFDDGKVRARAEGEAATEAKETVSDVPKRRTAKSGGDPGQGSLFGKQE